MSALFSVVYPGRSDPSGCSVLSNSRAPCSSEIGGVRKLARWWTWARRSPANSPRANCAIVQFVTGPPILPPRLCLGMLLLRGVASCDALFSDALPCSALLTMLCIGVLSFGMLILVDTSGVYANSPRLSLLLQNAISPGNLFLEIVHSPLAKANSLVGLVLSRVFVHSLGFGHG